LKSVYTMFLTSIASLTTLLEPYIAFNRPQFDPEAIPARQRFLARRIKLLKNILRWRKYTGEKLGIGELATRLVSGCILPVAESGWEVGGEEAVRKVCSFIIFWFYESDFRRRSLPCYQVSSSRHQSRAKWDCRSFVR
jgi:GC-rich sequence DNA-binding factor